MSETTKLAIFVTGSGTNCENIIRYFSDKPEVEIPIVVSSRSDAYALVRAEQLGVPTAVITRQQFVDEPRLVIHTVRGCDYIILAGFLPKIPTYLIDQFPNRIINIHPALLPKFGGKGMWGHHVHEAVKAAGETETGMTVHWVTPICDAGEIIAQFKVALSPDDTVDDIAEKEHQLEMAHFPKVVEDILKNAADD